MLITGNTWATIPKHLESYSSRPGINSIFPSNSREQKSISDPSWTKFKQGHIEGAATFLEMYPNHEIFFLGRDTEPFHDFVKVATQGTADEKTLLQKKVLLRVGTSNQLFRIEPREVFRAPLPPLGPPQHLAPLFSLGSVLFLLLGIEFQSIWFREYMITTPLKIMAEILGKLESVEVATKRILTSGGGEVCDSFQLKNDDRVIFKAEKEEVQEKYRWLFFNAQPKTHPYMVFNLGKLKEMF